MQLFGKGGHVQPFRNNQKNNNRRNFTFGDLIIGVLRQFLKQHFSSKFSKTITFIGKYRNFERKNECFTCFTRIKEIKRFICKGEC